MAAPTNTVSYGGFSFPFTKLNVVSSTEYASDGATVIGTAYQFNISGVLTGADAATTAQQILNLRSFCNAPRKELIIAWDTGAGSSEFWDFTNTDDIKWGPKPGELTVNQFFGGRAAFYSWSVAVMIKECATLGGTCVLTSRNNEILAITRQFDHKISPDGLTTRTISGRLYLTSKAQIAGYTPDHLRFYVTPTLPSGYQRKDMDFQTSEDGLVLSYSFVDQEVAWTLPQPMTDGASNWRVSIEELGAVMNFELSGWYSAPPQIAKSAIIQSILDLIGSKFSAIPSGTVFFDTNSFDEDVYNNRVSYSVKAHAVGQAQNGAFTLADSYSTIGIPPPNSTGQNYIPSPYGGDLTNGTSGTIAFPFPQSSGTLYDACTAGALSLYGTPTSAGTQGSGGGPGSGSTGGTGGGSSFSPGDLTSDALAAPYIEHMERIVYSVNNHIRTFLPKNLSGSTPPYNPSFQQTAPPLMTIIQAGYSIRDVRDSDSMNTARLPQPMPPALKTNVIMLKADVTGATPVPVGLANGSRWRCDWCYIMRAKFGFTAPEDLTGTDKALVFPIDPRTQDPNTATGQPMAALNDKDVVNPTVTPPA